MGNDDEQRADREIIRTAQREAAAAVRHYNSARTGGGGVPTRVQRTLADAALNYYEALHEYRGEDALSDPWNERGITWLENAADQTVMTEKSLPRANGASATTQRPALLAIPPSKIHDAIRELNDVAKELGFSPSAKKGTTRTEITEDLIKEAEEWRQKNLE